MKISTVRLNVPVNDTGRSRGSIHKEKRGGGKNELTARIYDAVTTEKKNKMYHLQEVLLEDTTEMWRTSLGGLDFEEVGGGIEVL